jgi:integrase
MAPEQGETVTQAPTHRRVLVSGCVRRNRVTVNGRVIEQQTTKTKAGHRTVPLSDFAVATLLAWQLRQGEEAVAAQEAWQTEGHVLHHGWRPSPRSRLRQAAFQKLRKRPLRNYPTDLPWPAALRRIADDRLPRGHRGSIQAPRARLDRDHQ